MRNNGALGRESPVDERTERALSRGGTQPGRDETEETTEFL